MAIKPQMRPEGLTGDPLVQQRQARTSSFSRRAVESDVSLRETDLEREDREVVRGTALFLSRLHRLTFFNREQCNDNDNAWLSRPENSN